MQEGTAERHEHAAGGADFGATVTIFFSDIRGFTEYTDAHGDAASWRMLQHHNDIVREQIALFGGHVVKTIGDSFMVSFNAARPAISCAVAIQRVLEQYNRGEQRARIDVGVGINTGEPVQEAGDLFGGAVNLAARICAVAGPGEILVSETVRGLVGRMEGVGIELRGDVALKGFHDPQRLYRIVWDGTAGSGSVPVGAPETAPAASKTAAASVTKPMPAFLRSRRPLIAAGAALLALAAAVVLGLRFLAQPAARPTAALPPHGALLFDLRDGARLNQGQGNPAIDRLTRRPEGIIFEVGSNGFVAVAPPGLMTEDFVAEVRMRRLSGAGYAALLFHVGDSGYHLVRINMETGAVEARRAPSGVHRAEDQAVLSERGLQVAPPTPGQTLQLIVSATGPEIVARVDGIELLRINDAGGAGGVEFTVGSERNQPFSAELVDWRIYAPA